MFSNVEQRYVWKSEAVYDLDDNLPSYLFDGIVEALMGPFPAPGS